MRRHLVGRPKPTIPIRPQSLDCVIKSQNICEQSDCVPFFWFVLIHSESRLVKYEAPSAVYLFIFYTRRVTTHEPEHVYKRENTRAPERFPLHSRRLDRGDKQEKKWRRAASFISTTFDRVAALLLD